MGRDTKAKYRTALDKLIRVGEKVIFAQLANIKMDPSVTITFSKYLVVKTTALANGGNIFLISFKV